MLAPYAWGQGKGAQRIPPIWHCTKFEARAIRQENEITNIQMGKEEAKLSLFADNVIVYVDDPTETPVHS